jgi:nitrite reductase (NO-forming)
MNERVGHNKISEVTVFSLVLCLFISVVLVVGVMGIRAMDGDTTTKVASAAAAPSATTPTVETSNNAVIDPAAMPAASWNPRDPILPSATTDTAHAVTFEMSEVQVEVAPGVMQEMWTFNGQVPGPTLRGKVGDTFTVTVVNKGKMTHSIDFHASKVAWSDEMRSIAPGESLVYTFLAEF